MNVSGKVMIEFDGVGMIDALEAARVSLTRIDTKAEMIDGGVRWNLSKTAPAGYEVWLTEDTEGKRITVKRKEGVLK